jgi:dihydrofolate reductase
MGMVFVVNHMTLDGVMQSPGRADEDPRDGFAHGGWAQAANDPMMMRAMAPGLAADGALLLGRRTFEDFAAYWPAQTDSPFSQALTRKRKYVASTTLSADPEWSGSTLMRGDVPQAVRDLKEGDGADLTILGSGVLLRSLLPHGLIDRWILLIHPLILGAGRRMFGEGSPTGLRLADSVTTSTGVIIATYEPGGDR